MQEKINQYLSELESRRQIKILLACETGSRAWGFPSSDSDYDIRLIYMHQKDWYLSLSEKKDTIEMMLENNELDISGWDLRKSLRLLKKSNAAILERIQSPIIYREVPFFCSTMGTLAPLYYSRIATLYHYLGLAQNTLDDVLNKDTFKLKKLFYVLRSATACRWILSKEVSPPILFITMVEELDFPPTLRRRIYDLIDFKKQTDESYLHKGETELIDFICTMINESKDASHSMPSAQSNNIEPLDHFFIHLLNQI